MPIHSAAVLGSGIMGLGIAALLANVGIPTLLLDLAAPEGQARDARARQAIERGLLAKPSPFFARSASTLLTTGTLEDDLAKLAGVDWVIEAVVEDLEVKRALFAKIAPIVGEQTIVSSNTSGFTAQALSSGLGSHFSRRFLITHFFNPVRVMKLLEVVATPGGNPEVFRQITELARTTLGKGVVQAEDRPGFIANRIGVYSLLSAIGRMVDEDFTIDEVDALLGPTLGRPRSAVFRTADLSGLDTLLHVAEHLYASLPEDECRNTFKVPSLFRTLVERGWLGEKSGQGFYRRVKDGGESRILTLNRATMSYDAQSRARFPVLEKVRAISDPATRIRQVIGADDRGARFAWAALADQLVYAANRIPEISSSIESIDAAMRWGFNWDLGPFEVWDALGVDYVVTRLHAEGRAVPLLAEQVLQTSGSFYGGVGPRRSVFSVATQSLEPLAPSEQKFKLTELKAEHARERSEDHARAGAVLRARTGVSLVSLGDGVACLEFNTRMNALDRDLIEAMAESVEAAQARGFRALVIGNDAANFSAGANLSVLLEASRTSDWQQVEALVTSLQLAAMSLKYAPMPVVIAATGYALGGGCEVLLHGALVHAHAELYCGLVEITMGLIPAGGGCKELLLRRGAAEAGQDRLVPVQAAFDLIAGAKVSTSAEEAREMGFLRSKDRVTLNRDRVLAGAKADAIALADSGYTAPNRSHLRLSGADGHRILEQQIEEQRNAGTLSEHDALVRRKLAYVLTGGTASPTGSSSEQDVLNLEREAFLSLCGMPLTQERIAAFLRTGKPLRN